MTPVTLSRRTFLTRTGLGTVALATLLQRAAANGRWTGVVNPLHLAPKAKRVIFLYLAGGPSQFETFDHKPKLAEMDGRPMPASLTEGQSIAQLQGQKLYCLRPLFRFARHGQSGQEITDLYPQLARHADEMAIIRSMHTDAINHDPANTLMNTGTLISGRPSMGSWVLYGLGSETDELPGFVVLDSHAGRNPQPISTRMWHSGFLPSQLQGVPLRSTGDPVLYVRPPNGVDPDRQREVVNAVQALNRSHDSVVNDPEIATRVAQYEMAFRMQMSVPELMDLSREPRAVLDLYGTPGADGSFAANCLLARRLAERGVRFIQLYHKGWDHHNGLEGYMRICCASADQAVHALLTDLRQRGLLDETLVVCSGEFGRTPMAQSNKGAVGRDHHMKSFSCWLAGGGVKDGVTYGETDEFGYNAVVNPVHVNDLHATMLHLLGIEHTRMTLKFQGLDMRLTGVAGRVVRDVLA